LLVQKHERQVRTFLARVAGHEAEDLAQETFVKAWRLAGSFRGEGSYPGWLLRIGWRLFLDERRSRKPVEALDGDISEAGESGAPERKIDVDRALARLHPRERAAALLCLGEGYSHAEAAAILALPLGTLKSIVARAKAQLAAWLLEVETN
jgi:RNA polymerase sigma factor (sigma-70 family)